MVIEGFLPIGSVVLLKNSTKRVMITGVGQKGTTESGEKLYDYVGVVYPEGYQNAELNYLFNTDQIDSLYFIGFQDAEFFAFKDKADEVMKELRAEEAAGQ